MLDWEGAAGRRLILFGAAAQSGAAMQLDANTQLSLAAVVMAGLALIFSLFAAFPGLKGMLSVVRDGVLWLAMLLLLSGVGFVVFQRLQQTPSVTQRPPLEDFSNRETMFRPQLPEPRRP